MLPLIIGGAAAINAIVDPCQPPGIETIAPFPHHAVDDVAMAVHQDGRQRCTFAMLRQKKRRLPARGLNQAGGEVELGERRLQFLFEIGAQGVRPLGILALRPKTHPAVELSEECTG